MGQEQSVETAEAANLTLYRGVQRVSGTGSAVERNTETSSDPILQQASELPLPQPVLPPPPIPDDVSSALQGAQVMHELRSMLSVLLPGQSDADKVSRVDASALEQVDRGATAEQSATSMPHTQLPAGDGTQARDVAASSGSFSRRRTSSIKEVETHPSVDISEEQQLWVRLGIDANAVENVLKSLSGGERLERVLDTQDKLQSLILLLGQRAVRVRRAVEKAHRSAVELSRSMDRMDRLKMDVTEIQDSLQSSIATANILGAAHFANDDEMCSFKNFLKYNPPTLPDASGKPPS